MKHEPLILPRNCGNCKHFDEDVNCALPPHLGLVLMHRISYPYHVVCTKHEDKRDEDVDGAAV